MTNAMHTPGPWIFEYAPYTALSGDEIPAFEIFGEGEKLCDTNENRPLKEQEANAMLIAASPDLLEALERLHRLSGSGLRFGDGDAGVNILHREGVLRPVDHAHSAKAN